MADARPGPVIAVVGAGIAGLAAAWELATTSDLAPGTGPPIVVVLDADDRAGGKLASAEFDGRTVDLAADAFLARRPEATDLVDELGIADELVPVGTSGASILARGRLRPMPAGLALGVPTRWWPLARSGLLSPTESLRVARDLLLPHGSAGTPGDRSVADIVAKRLGRPVVERLVDPLIGGINAGGVDELSAAATFPALIAASHQPGSLMRALRRLPAPDSEGPVFWSLHDGTASLADRLVERLAETGGQWKVSVRTGVSVDDITQLPGSATAPRRWGLTLRGTGASSVTGAAGGTERTWWRTASSSHVPPLGRGAAGFLRPGGGRDAQHHRVRLGGGGDDGHPHRRHRRQARGLRISGAADLPHRRSAGADDRLHLPVPKMAAPGHRRPRADPGLGGT